MVSPRKEHINMTEYQNNNHKIGAIFALFPHVLLKTSENPGTTATFNV